MTDAEDRVRAALADMLDMIDYLHPDRSMAALGIKGVRRRDAARAALLAERQAPTPTDDEREAMVQAAWAEGNTSYLTARAMVDAAISVRQPSAPSGMTPDALAERIDLHTPEDRYYRDGSFRESWCYGCKREVNGWGFRHTAEAILAEFPIVVQAPTLPTREALARAFYDRRRGAFTPPFEESSWEKRDAFADADVALALLSLEARDTDAPHDRDRMGICRCCGQGLSAADIVDGEKPCEARDTDRTDGGGI